MAESRDAYVRKLKAKLDEWNLAVDRLEARAQHSRAGGRDQIVRTLESLRDQREKAMQTLGQLRTASDEAWEGVRSRAARTWHEIQETLERTKSRFL